MESNLAVLFVSVYQYVKSNGRYVPRSAPTIGGFWTTDRWRLGEVEAWLEDEGYTQRLKAPGLEIVYGYNQPVEFVKGDATMLEDVALKVVCEP